MKENIQKIQNKTRELQTLQNRLHRYWKKLVAISIGVAKEKGIKTEILEVGELPSDLSKIQVYEDSNGFAYADNLLKLAKNKEPSLYRKYQDGKIRYEQGINELEAMVN